MSGSNNSVFPFPGMEDSEGLDIDTIFGGGGTDSGVDPFDLSAAQDERATRLYTVLGRLDQFFPEITVRMSCGGIYCQMDPALVFEGLGESFPREWR